MVEASIGSLRLAADDLNAISETGIVDEEKRYGNFEIQSSDGSDIQPEMVDR